MFQAGHHPRRFVNEPLLMLVDTTNSNKQTKKKILSQEASQLLLFIAKIHLCRASLSLYHFRLVSGQHRKQGSDWLLQDPS